MPDSRRSLHLGLATLAALLGLQLASCADVASGRPGPAGHPDAHPDHPSDRASCRRRVCAAGDAAPRRSPVAPQIALLLPLTGAQSAAATRCAMDS